MAASSSSSISSSSSSHVPQTKYDVFISFRGEDIRDNFLSHLLKELRNSQIDVYEDERLRPGDEISSSLVQAIEESPISLVIFSQDYASSRWCMQELLKILECSKHYHHRIVIPVFYKVQPCDVRHQRASFAEAFSRHQERFEENVVMEWRSALEKIANLSGLHYQYPSQKYKNECEFIEKIVKDVSEKLCHVFTSEIKGLVGMDEHIESIESLLHVQLGKVQTVGIWGMGGIGKTTIAKVVFKKYFSNYEGRCFLENVREKSEKDDGLRSLFQRLAYELLQDEKILSGGLSETQIENAKRRLSRLKVLLVLDDVNSPQQLKHLIGNPIHLGAGSRIIITTRDKQILTVTGVHGVYDVKPLNFENSLQLFCLNAFSQTYPEQDYKEQSEMAVHYAKGIPLALTVLGSHLTSRSIPVWKDELAKFELHPLNDIVDVLRWSYDKLDDSWTKDIFLDIAFFFKGKNKDEVISILRACDFHPVAGIDILERKALITISEDNKIEMHDLIEKMGWQVVFEESKNPPAMPSRLRNPKDVDYVLKNNKGSDSIRGIMFDLSRINKDLYLHADTFNKMDRLRILKVVYASGYNGRPSNVHTRAELESFSDYLRYLEWDEYPSESLPSSFCVENLVELHMPRSQVSKLPKELGSLTSLEKLNLSKCIDIIKLPKELCSLTSLTELDLSGCIRLIELPGNIKALTRLTTLDIHDCWGLQCLPELPSSITALDADNCTSLQSVISIDAISSYNWTMFSFKNCISLDGQSLNAFKKFVHDIMVGCAIGDRPQRQPIYKGDICYPGSEVPECFKYKTTEAFISLPLDQPDNLSGFFLCFVIPELPSGAIECEYYLGDGEMGRFEIPLVEIRDSLKSDHVYIWYEHQEKLLDEIKKCKANGHGTILSQNISFKFVIQPPIMQAQPERVKRWGVSPL